MEHPKSILLAEDNPEDVELTLAAFSEYNFENDVVVARDGAEALDYLYARGSFQKRPPGNPTVILLDINMPKVNGLEVLRTIKGDETLKTIPVIIMTTSQQEAHIAESRALGVNAYIEKPVNFREFILSIKGLGIFWTLLNEPPPENLDKLK
ncbi:MAG TPA: response regulator [Candidatus Manganitrophaceae bacterium]|nr:response regulator [Candidatus Manganitrophaceae bacterium]